MFAFFLVVFLVAFIMYAIYFGKLKDALKREAPEALVLMQRKALQSDNELFAVLNFILGAKGLPNELSTDLRALMFRARAALALGVVAFLTFILNL